MGWIDHRERWSETIEASRANVVDCLSGQPPPSEIDGDDEASLMEVDRSKEVDVPVAWIMRASCFSRGRGEFSVEFSLESRF